MATQAPLYFILADNKEKHTRLDGYEFHPDPTADYAIWPDRMIDYRVSYPLASGKIPMDL